MKRHDHETYEEYCERRKEAQYEEKLQRQGKMLWYSPKMGTYIMEAYGKLKPMVKESEDE